VTAGEDLTLVWIVDDSPLDAERARKVLAGHHEVEVFSDGSAMLEHLSNHRPPDVLVLDWVMPGVSGIEVCRFLRQGNGARPELAILLLTMQTRTDDIVEGLAAGANDYVVKPYADLELRARVDALICSSGRSGRRRASSSCSSTLPIRSSASTGRTESPTSTQRPSASSDSRPARSRAERSVSSCPAWRRSVSTRPRARRCP